MIPFFDIESTGTSVTKDKIISLSIIVTDFNFNILEKKKLLVNPGILIPEEATAVHGITNEVVALLPEFKEYAKGIFSFISKFDYIAGFNSKMFDTPMLCEEFARCGIIWNPGKQIDCSVIFKKREARTLSAAMKFYCDKELDGAHDAENDVLATIEVLKGQIQKYGLDKQLHLISESEEHAKEGYVPLLDFLLSESKYEGEDNRVDFAGKIILNKDGVAVWNFGKYKDMNVPVSFDRGYCDWCLNTPDITFNTKNVIRSILNIK